MPEQHRHLANKCEYTVNLQGAEAYCVATRTACYQHYCGKYASRVIEYYSRTEQEALQRPQIASKAADPVKLLEVPRPVSHW